MQTLDWLETHVGSLNDGIELANRFHWFLSTVMVARGGKPYWYVKNGESVIFSADSQEAVNAFLYGMSLAYAGIPDDLFEHLIDETKKDWF